ncbi:2-C-methyl-D-erythritol 4-phosphate cytidylyltransferase [Halomonas halocynthiae]|uniref:2-C-methyl-D-erythritol 4-phosphate cytidylyltransferase n=1 Tax=Halomonas halocynthiae TaxID=176290 RepID=UPI0004185734|nr:2-C-methyl-D-erythritol 4-phosphate cytidylyltransferase [Halomonas halocynthiae]
MSACLWLVVPAAGCGSRMKAARPKQYLELAGRPVIQHTLSRLHGALPAAKLCLCLDDNDVYFDPSWVPFSPWQRVSGGVERMDSVLNALQAIGSKARSDDIVLVHDIARPCVLPADLERLLDAVQRGPAGALLAAPVADTMKRDNGAGHVLRSEPRDGLWHALTPQGFRYALLRRALEQAKATGQQVTDDASAVEALGLSPELVVGRRDNIKITHPEDLGLATHILVAQRASDYSF